MVSGPQSRDQRARDRTAPGGDPRRDARHGPVGGALDLGFAGSDHRADLRRLLDVIGYRIFNSMMEENCYEEVRSGARHGLLMVLLLSGTSGLAAEMTGP